MALVPGQRPRRFRGDAGEAVVKTTASAEDPQRTAPVQGGSGPISPTMAQVVQTGVFHKRNCVVAALTSLRYGRDDRNL
jgi:hypothetical protein